MGVYYLGILDIHRCELESCYCRLFFVSSIDDYRLYDYALNGIEIACLYTDLVKDAEVCASPPEFDLTRPSGEPDCVVDLYDFTVMTSTWLECGLLPQSACN